MTLIEILSAERVASIPSISSKKKALEELSSLLCTGIPTLDSHDVFAGLTGREKLGSTGLGRGVAIPHARIATLDHGVGAFMRLKSPVNYDAHDGNPVDLFFGLLVPQSMTDGHLQHLAAIAEMFSDATFCAGLRSAADPAALFELLSGYSPAR